MYSIVNIYNRIYTMELAIPIIAFTGLYMASKEPKENFKNRLPNTDIPDQNYNYAGEDKQDPQLLENNTSKLSTLNNYDSNTAYTDKYFQGKNLYPKTSGNNSFTSMTGKQVNASYFEHNNMTPYFGSKNRSTILEAESSEGILDTYSGSGTQHINKKEQSPLFSPQDNYQHAYGAPNKNDFYQSRVNPSMRMANTKPFESQMVAPGLGLGANTNQGSGGYNSGMAVRDKWLPKNVDQMRTVNNQRAGGIGLLGHEGPAVSGVQTLGNIGKMEKNRVERTWNMGPERYFTTTGVEKAPPLHAKHIDRYVNRPETSASYTGNASTNIPESYQTGEYMDSKHMDLGSMPLGIASATGKHSGTTDDFEKNSKRAYPNNRSLDNDTYFGAVGSAVSAVVSPLLDELRPSRKENAIGTLRPYQNPHTAVTSSYLFNPADRPNTTIRETTESNKYIPGINSNQNGGAYQTTAIQPTAQERDTTSISYTGNSSAGAGTKSLRPYDAEYRQRNNDIKSSTIKGHMVPGNMNLYNANINMKNKQGEIYNNRQNIHTNGPTQTSHVQQMGDTHHKRLYNSNVQLDRNNPEILNAFKSNPFTHSLTHVP